MFQSFLGFVNNEDKIFHHFLDDFDRFLWKHRVLRMENKSSFFYVYFNLNLVVFFNPRQKGFHLSKKHQKEEAIIAIKHILILEFENWQIVVKFLQNSEKFLICEPIGMTDESIFQCKCCRNMSSFKCLFYFFGILQFLDHIAIRKKDALHFSLHLKYFILK